jgi:hypothetical protein
MKKAPLKFPVSLWSADLANLESVEMTLFHQAEKRRLLVCLLKMNWH